jgi:4-hydroxy-4-methyl-2-oxoglutarate aldolase
MIVPKAGAEAALQASRARLDKEQQTRVRLAAGELGLDIYRMREALAAKGLTYLD